MGSESATNLPQNLKEINIDDTCQEGHFISETSSPVITINVGGVLFSTHSATLQKVGTLGLHGSSIHEESNDASSRC